MSEKPPARSFTVRRLRAADVAPMRNMLAMFGAAFDDEAAYCGAPPRDDYLRDLLDRADFVALAALGDDEVIGGLAAYLLRKFEQERSELYIYDLAVALAHRRLGVATALIERLKSVARELGADVIYVQADPEDAPAVALYARLGRREDVLHFDIMPG